MEENSTVIAEVQISDLNELINKLQEITSKIRYELTYSTKGVQKKKAMAKREKDALILQIKERLRTVSKEEADRTKSRLISDLGIYIYT